MSAALAATKKVQFGERKIEVKKLNLRGIATLLKALESIPDELLNQKEGEGKNFIKKLPTIIVELLPKYSELVSEILEGQVSGAEIQEGDLNEVFDLVEAFLQINDINGIMTRMGKVKDLAMGKAK